MPNHGRSGRCLTCKRRRVKCDESRPACLECRRLGLQCGGYHKIYNFRDETHKFGALSKLQSSIQDSHPAPYTAAMGEPGRSLFTEADIAVPFFLAHYAGLGRSLIAARGFFETLIPVHASQTEGSPLSLAVAALAMRVFALWRHNDVTQAGCHTTFYTRAIATLRAALGNQDTRSRPATALAVLALHLYESISAIYDGRSAMPIHHHGALTLLSITASKDSDDGFGKYVKGFVLHSEISSALRQKRCIHPDALAYVQNPCQTFLVPGNFSLTLDAIGASVAELQADYVHVMSQQHPTSPLLEEKCGAWMLDAARLTELLEAWARTVPDHWRPLRLNSGTDFSPSIAAFQSACDIYPSCQIGTLWNLWRFHRLVLLGITASVAQLPFDTLRNSAGEATLADQIRELMDSICYSVPFYLGNRFKQFSLNDFADSKLSFPSFHTMASDDARIVKNRQESADAVLSHNEHHFHVLAYGAWHILSPLSKILTMVSEGPGGQYVAQCLRPGQQEWIRQQFLRVSTVVRLPAAHSCGDTPPLRWPMTSASAGGAAEALAKQVRQSTSYMSGP